MAMRIYNNTQAINAQKNLAIANNSTSKTLEKLSSGLRINRASDDASGLAISEKLRGQIRGLKRASMNAQDGISFLQTAEGGLSEVSNIIQRMRELAVQAGNGTFTTNDRKELQKEIDQMKDEINRISAATEFNTKKLLNGDATALWSSDNNAIDVIVNGAVVEGNYELTVTAQAGSNYVYNTDVMTLKDGSIGAEKVSEITTAGSTNVGLISDPNTLNSTGTSYYTVTVSNTSAVTTTSGLNGTYSQAGSSWGVGSFDQTAAFTTAGYLQIEFTETTSAAGSLKATSYTASFVDAKTGAVTTLSTGDTTSAGVSLAVAGQTFTANITLSPGGQIQKGDKMLFSISDTTGAVGMLASGGGSLQITGGPNGATGPVLQYTAESSLTAADNSDTTLDYKSATIYIASLDAENGNLDVGNMTLEFKENTQTADTGTAGQTTSGAFTVQISGGGEAASSSTRLKDLAGFTNDDGRAILDATQELKIYGNGKEATIFVEGDDTINELEQKLTSAIVDQLGMGATKDLASDYTSINSQLVNYVTAADETASTDQSTAGTFVIQTALIGEESGLSFVGDQSLIDALGVNIVQEGINSELKVSVTNANDGSNLGVETVNDYTLRSVIEGAEVRIDSSTGISASWDSTNKELDFSASTSSNTFKLHLKDNRTEIQIGANEGQTIDVSVAQVDTKSLEIDDIVLVDLSSSQKAISKLDTALAEVASTRATIGAQISRMESTIVNLETARENLAASESRIRDLDIAEETSKFTRNQILVQASTAMLAQANQLPQMALQLLG